jgi:hypothetical protein
MSSPHFIDLRTLLKENAMLNSIALPTMDRPRDDRAPADRRSDAVLVRRRVAAGFDRELLTQPAVAVVDSGLEALVGGDPLEEHRELLAFCGVEGGADGVLVGDGSPGQLAHEPAALGGEMQGVVAAVGGIAAALDQPSLFQAVNKDTVPADRLT